MPRLAYFGPHGMPKSQWRFWRKAWNAKDERPPTLFPQTWMKVVKPFDPQQPSNVVQFECSFQMNKIEIKDYLTTIYNVAPTKVNTVEKSLQKIPEIRIIENQYIIYLLTKLSLR